MGERRRALGEGRGEYRVVSEGAFGHIRRGFHLNVDCTASLCSRVEAKDGVGDGGGRRSSHAGIEGTALVGLVVLE